MTKRQESRGLSRRRFLQTSVAAGAALGAGPIFAPAVPTDRSDPQIVHLDGLNLSRAQCCADVANALPPGDARARVLQGAAAAHRAAGLLGVESGDYMGAHWLATFAVLAIDGA